MALIRPVLHRLSCSRETVRHAPKHEFWVQWSGSGTFITKKSQRNFISRTCALMAPVRPVFHRLSCCNGTVRNARKHEFWVQWSGSHAFVAKNANATSFSKLVRQWRLFVLSCIVFRAVSKRSERPQFMTFRSNGVDLVRWLRKLKTRLHLANFCVNGSSSASFASSFVQ
jgi:hypothetical protein